MGRSVDGLQGSGYQFAHFPSLSTSQTASKYLICRGGRRVAEALQFWHPNILLVAISTMVTPLGLSEEKMAEAGAHKIPGNILTWSNGFSVSLLL